MCNPQPLPINLTHCLDASTVQTCPPTTQHDLVPSPPRYAVTRKQASVFLPRMESETDYAESIMRQLRRNLPLSAWNILSNFFYRRLQIQNIKLIGANPLASGGQGEIMLGSFAWPSSGESTSKDPELKLAVKMFRISSWRDQGKDYNAFANEVSLLSDLSHPNIAQLWGFVEDGTKRIAWLVFRWEANGNLREFLLSGDWAIPERISLINDVACGLHYLHGRNPPICHGDLKGVNILVDSEHHALISDFGSARIRKTGIESTCDTQTTDTSPFPDSPTNSLRLKHCASTGTLVLTGPKYTLRWAAPEILLASHFDLPGDIWAFGWICWEVMTGNLPFPESQLRIDITMQIIRGQLPKIDDNAQASQIKSVCSLMMDCWKMCPKDRPDAKRCMGVLRWLPASVPSHRDQKTGDVIKSAELLYQMGEMHRRQNRLDEASTHIRKSSEISHRTGDHIGSGKALLSLGHVLRAQAKYADAEASYTQALEIFTREDQSQGRAESLIGLGHNYAIQYKHVEARKAYDDSLAISILAGDELYRANALIGLGRVSHNQSNDIEAEALYLEAATILTNLEFDHAKVSALLGLGDIYRSQRNFHKAEESYRETIQVSVRAGDESSRAGALVGLGFVQMAQSKYSEAKTAFEEAPEVFSRMRNSLGRGNALTGLAMVCMNANNPQAKEAERLFAEALQDYAAVDNLAGRANALEGLGDVCYRELRFSEAGAFYSEAVKSWGLARLKGNKASALVGLARVQRIQSDGAQADVSLTQALEIFRTVGNEIGEAGAWLEFGVSHLARLDLQDAKTAFDRAYQVFTRHKHVPGAERAERALSFIRQIEETSTQSHS